MGERTDALIEASRRAGAFALQACLVGLLILSGYWLVAWCVERHVTVEVFFAFAGLAAVAFVFIASYRQHRLLQHGEQARKK
jgi:predicted membrane metal-binding protein